MSCVVWFGAKLPVRNDNDTVYSSNPVLRGLNRRHRKRIEQWLKEQKLNKFLKTKTETIWPWLKGSHATENNLATRPFHSQTTSILGELHLSKAGLYGRESFVLVSRFF